MEREVVIEGPSVAEAVDAALEELGVQQDAVEYEVLEGEARGLFGAAKPARVRVWLRAGYVHEAAGGSAEEHDSEGSPSAGEASPVTALSEEEVDRIADEAVSAVQTILAGFGLSCEIDEYEGDYGELILDAVAEDAAVLIGRHGRTLDALQTLVSAVVFRKTGLRHPLLVDVSGYRYRRKSKLDEIARGAAERVRRTGQPVKLRPMSSYERKVIHMALREDARVTTASEGEEPFRQVVVLPR